jgi:small subunit ribosomal protein S3
MGQKIHPLGFRLGPVYTWSSRWYADSKTYSRFLREDVLLRRALFARLKTAGLAQVEIERSINKMKVILHVSRPGVVIGRGGTGMEEIKKYIAGLVAGSARKGDAQTKTDVVVEPVKEPNLNAYLVASNIADQLVKRMPHKRVCMATLDRVMNAGARGVKILLAGRIAGAEISRKEKYKAGSIPLSTIREAVDFAEVPSLTKSGYIGVKVWIYKPSN